VFFNGLIENSINVKILIKKFIGRPPVESTKEKNSRTITIRMWI